LSEEIYSFALKNALTEIGNACPDVKNSFMFKKDGEIVASDEQTQKEVAVHVVDAFDGILEKADAIGGIEGLTLEGSEGRVNVSCVDDLYLVTVTRKGADMNPVNVVTRVLIPTVLKLVEKISPAPLKNRIPTHRVEPEIPMVKESKQEKEEYAAKPETKGLETEEPAMEEPEKPAVTDVIPEPALPEPSASQFMVENLGGLLAPSDTVKIDGDTLQQWEELYNGRKIQQVEVKTFSGKSTQCKVKPINDPKYEGRGIIRMPEKIQVSLEIKKGELVSVKPVLN
jgi:predicted regulator of Ras-like GTPase activity (Roadblock/LC7/MglB family)